MSATDGEALAAGAADGWLADFHAGRREALEACYREHFDHVDRAVGSLVSGADRETLVHEVFYRLLSDRALRESFRGGSFPSWVATVARNLARDHLRRHQRLVFGAEAALQRTEGAGRLEAAAELRRLAERFRREKLPEKWWGVFETRFLLQLDQREAARRLGIGRTTLAYRELRIRALLERYVLGEEP